MMVILLIVMGLCGCMTNSGTGSRKETDSEYINMMKAYMEEKYSTTFEIVDYILPKSTISSGMELNVLVLRDSNGLTTNVRAKFGTPYHFYDDYVESCTAAKILSEIGFTNENIDALSLHVVVRNKSIETIDISPENVPSLTVVAKVADRPNDTNLQSLYEIYDQICALGYEDVYFLVGFVNNSSDFDAAVENYTVYGKSKWSDYNGAFFAYLSITSAGLSFDEFCCSVVK